jgi:glutathione S-transferase
MTVAPLVLNRHFKAPPERVFAAFTQEGLMQGWYGPEPMTVPHCEVDTRVGGKYRIEMHSSAGSVHVVTGEFKEIVAPERLVFTWGWLNGTGRNPETIVTLTFRARDGGTDLTLEQVGFLSEEFRESHRGGWTSSWNALDALLAGHSKATTAGPVVMGNGRSTYTRSARIAFFEKGIAHTHQPVAPQTADILAHNPFGKIPVLRLGEASLYESSAILRYIDETYPGPALMPSDPLARARAEQWISAFNCYADRAIVRNYVLQYAIPRGADGKPDRAAIEAAIPDVRKVLGVLEAAYGGNDYLVDDEISLPDILLAPAVDYLGAFAEGKELLSQFPNVRRAQDAFAARPSFIAATRPAA